MQRHFFHAYAICYAGKSTRADIIEPVVAFFVLARSFRLPRGASPGGTKQRSGVSRRARAQKRQKPREVATHGSHISDSTRRRPTRAFRR